MSNTTGWGRTGTGMTGITQSRSYRGSDSNQLGTSSNGITKVGEITST